MSYNRLWTEIIHLQNRDSKSPQKSVTKYEDTEESSENDPKIGFSNDDSGISSSNETKSPNKKTWI